jgi:acyl-CoA reductase-like NAD-dependent aldehyde dehydrogenase
LDNAIAFLLISTECSGRIMEDEKILTWYKQFLPIGVVIGLTPFSSPYSSFIQKLSSCLIFRDHFIFKPSSKATKCSEQIYYTIIKECSSSVKQLLSLFLCKDDDIISVLNDDSIKAILFTGKSETAKMIKKNVGRKRAVFETGSVAMAYIGKSANIEVAINNIVLGAFEQTGMRCVACKNVFVHDEIFERFCLKLMERVKKVKYGNEFEMDTQVGPIKDKSLLNVILSYIYKLKNNGYKLFFGGNVFNDVLVPTILCEGESYESLDEIYGPVLIIHKIKGWERISPNYLAISSLNVSFYSNDKSEIDCWLKYNHDSGTMIINDGPTLRKDLLEFGGFNDENEGKEGLFSISRVLTYERIVIETSYIKR